MPNIVKVHNLGMAGVIRDLPAHTIAPEVWSDAVNVRFTKSGAARTLGESQVFGTPSVLPYYVLPAAAANVTYWLYLSKLKAYVYDSGVHTNITRQTASVDVNYTTVDAWDWTHTMLGGIPIINNKVDVPQYWSGYNPALKLANLPNWPTGLTAKVIRSFGRYLIAINLTDTTVEYPHAIQWSNAADPGTVPADWDFNDATSDAGRIELTDPDGGPLKDGLMLGREMILYKANSTHTLRFVGGNDIFAPDLLFTGAGVLATRTAAAIKKGTQHLVLTESDVVVHAGQKSVASVIEDKNRRWLFSNIDSVNYPLSFVFDNSFTNEAWICFPSSGSDRCDLAAIYNYENGTWAFRDFDAAWAASGLITNTISTDWDSDSGTWDADLTPWGDLGARGILLASPLANQFKRLDVGNTLNSASISARLERTGLAIVGRDRQGQPKVDYEVVKQVNRITPKFTGDGIVNIQIGIQEDFASDVDWGQVYPFQIGVDKYIDMDPPRPTKLIGVRFTSNTEVSWQLEGYDLEIALLGNMGDLD